MGLVRRLLGVLAVGGLIFDGGVALAQEETYPLPANPLEGSRLFISKGCVQCHAIKGVGGTVGPDLGRVPIGRSLLSMAATMWNHSPKMTEKIKEIKMERPRFTTAEMATLMGYLYYINYFDEPGNIQDGKRLFREKGCASCHFLGGEGEKVGPALDKYKRYMSPLFLAQAMWNHGPAMAATMRRLGVKRAEFRENEMIDLLAYLRSAAKGTAEEPVYMLPGSPEKGKALFAEKGCVRCHAVHGKGGRVGPDLGQRHADFQQQSVTQVAGIMWNHGPRMWPKMEEIGIPFPRFSGKEMADLIAFLYFLPYFDEPGSTTRGKRVFEQKGCSACHSLKGKGGKEGPDLARVKGLASPIDVATAMWNHGATMERAFQAHQLEWPRFEPREMADLMEYLRAARQPAPGQK